MCVTSKGGTQRKMGAEIHVGESKTDAGAKLAQQILGWSQRAIQERGYFTVAFSGGSMPDVCSFFHVLVVTGFHFLGH